MERVEIPYTDHFDGVMKALTGGGLLLGAHDARGRPNAMTIGWGAIGSIWSMPMWVVLVRPSRYTYECVEHGDCFTVNVPAAGMDEALAICGSRSGRDGDKLADAGLTPADAVKVPAPTFAECPIVYECVVVHRNDVQPAALIPEIAKGPYADGDYHRVYYGRILAARAAENAADLL